MIGKHLKAATILGAMAGGSPLSAHAQNAAAIAGTYCLVGVMEVGSCIRLSAGGRFEYFLAYGAYDEKSEGTWRVERGGVVIDSRAYDKRPAFSFKRTQRGDDDAFGVIVESKNGRRLAGFDVSVTCDGSTKRAGVTQAVGFAITCNNAPTAVALGVRMYGLAPQAIDVADKAGAGKVYVFAFDPGDLGGKRFAGHRLRINAAGALVMTYADTPIIELDGRSFEYVRSR